MMITWQQFISLAANRKLSLKEQKKKFLQENAQQLRHLEYIQAMFGQNGAGGAAGSGGVVLDGPISGATVVSNVGSATTDATGNFTLPGKPSGTITVTGGTDAITGLPYEGELIGDAQYKTISPITTFAHYLKEASKEDADSENPALTFEQAIDKTFNESFDYFGIALPIEDKDVILQKDFVKEAIENNNRLGIAAQAVATQIEAIAETIGVALDESNEAQSARKQEKEISEFSEKNRKRTAYRALGRQARKSTASGGKADISPKKILERVSYVNPTKGGESTSVGLTNTSALETQLAETKRELINVSRQEQYTNNYLTTQIQAVNRAQKTVIKNEVASVVTSSLAKFKDIVEEANSNTVKDALKPIEKDKANEKSPVVDGKPRSVPSEGSVTVQWKQVRKVEGEGKALQTLTLSDKNLGYSYFGSDKDLPLLLLSAPGDKYIVASLNATRTEEDLTKILLNTPVIVQDTRSTLEADTVTTYTLLPTIASAKGEDTILVNLRLTRLTTTVTQKTINHIVANDKSITYTAVFNPNGGDKITQSTTLTNEELDGKFEIGMLLMGDPDAKKDAGRFRLSRYLIVGDGKEEAVSPLLKLTHTANASLGVEKLAFTDKSLSIAVPATKATGDEVDIPAGTLDIAFTIASGPGDFGGK